MSDANEVVVVERKWSIFSACMVAEGADTVETEEEYLSAWQYLINLGIVWQLQGFYGRTALALAEQGLVTLPGRA